MSDHGSGPRALSDPVVDITDVYAFPSPDRPGVLVVVLNTFPFAGPTALFSDAVDYRIRLRPAAIGDRAFVVDEKEVTLTYRFMAPSDSAANDMAQGGTLVVSSGQSVSFRVNDVAGGEGDGARVFAGVRLDPFFFDGGAMGRTMQARRLSFDEVGQSTVFRQNVLSIVTEIEIASVFAPGDGPLFAVVGETARTGPITVRFERYGRPEIKNFLMMIADFDPMEKAIDLRDLYNQEDTFRPTPTYQTAFRARINANLKFFDSLDGKTDWLIDSAGDHPLASLLLADFMTVDMSQPFAETGYFEIERALLEGVPHTSCGGRSLNEDSIDKFLSILVNNGNGSQISDGLDQATVPCSDVFPYLQPPELDPPAPKKPAVLAN